MGSIRWAGLIVVGAVLALSSAGASAQQAQGGLAEAQDRLRRAEGLLSELQGASRRAPEPSASCLRSFSLKGLAAEFKDGSLPADVKEAFLVQALPQLEKALICRTYTTADLASCDDADAFGVTVRREEGAGDIPFKLLCQTVYYEILLARAYLTRGPDMKELCVKRNLIGDRDFKLDSLDAACAIVARFSGDTEATCGSLAPYFDNASIAKTCPRMHRYISGDETVCPVMTDPMVHERCLGYVAFRKARARDRRPCAVEPFCRMLTGAGPALCETYRPAMARTLCRLKVQPPYLKHRGRQVVALLDEAEDALRGLEPEAADPALARRLDAGGEKAARLRQRYQSWAKALR